MKSALDNLSGNKLPPIKLYSELLSTAVDKFKININSARNKYGKYIIDEWKELLDL